MPGYCDVCGRSSSWFWSNYDNWWNPRLYCSFKCNAVGSAPLHLLFGTVISIIGLLAFFSGGFLLLFLGIFFVLLGVYGIKANSYGEFDTVDSDSSFDYEQTEQNYDDTQDDALRDMYT